MIGITVHTTGVNWEGVLTNSALISAAVGTLVTLLARSIRRANRDNIEAVITQAVARDITPKFAEINSTLHEMQQTTNNHSTRIARLEGIQEGRKMTVAEAGVTTKGT